CPGKCFELIAKPAQPSKPLFNIKETNLFHSAIPQSDPEEWNHIESLKTRWFFDPSNCVSLCDRKLAAADDIVLVSCSINEKGGSDP
ncbi:hypothetical protein, partial [Gluconobacter cerinus]|uniref:hypothetical protein n=1 Tax=Gluconobacter cerinus TaxID=38307 RepID=UPI001B8B7FDF